MAAGGKLTEKQVQDVAQALDGRADPVAVKELKEELKDGASLTPGKVAAAT